MPARWKPRHWHHRLKSPKAKAHPSNMIETTVATRKGLMKAMTTLARDLPPPVATTAVVPDGNESIAQNIKRRKILLTANARNDIDQDLHRHHQNAERKSGPDRRTRNERLVAYVVHIPSSIISSTRLLLPSDGIRCHGISSSSHTRNHLNLCIFGGDYLSQQMKRSNSRC